MRTVAFFVLLLAGWRLSTPRNLDADLDAARGKMLLTVTRTTNSTGITDPQEVYKKLTLDRRAVFDSILRALFLELEDDNGLGTGTRIITYLEAVHGIWGVRVGEPEGKKQFRLSVRSGRELARCARRIIEHAARTTWTRTHAGVQGR